jgi:hypothetical protein
MYPHDSSKVPSMITPMPIGRLIRHLARIPQLSGFDVE